MDEWILISCNGLLPAHFEGAQVNEEISCVSLLKQTHMGSAMSNSSANLISKSEIYIIFRQSQMSEGNSISFNCVPPTLTSKLCYPCTNHISPTYSASEYVQIAFAKDYAKTQILEVDVYVRNKNENLDKSCDESSQGATCYSSEKLGTAYIILISRSSSNPAPLTSASPIISPSNGLVGEFYYTVQHFKVTTGCVVPHCRCIYCSCVRSKKNCTRQKDHVSSFLVGHRGNGAISSDVNAPCDRTGRRKPPENTLDSFEKAIQVDKISFVEIDVHLTADRIPIVFHDFKVNVASNNSALTIPVPIAHLTLKELEGIRIAEHRTSHFKAVVTNHWNEIIERSESASQREAPSNLHLNSWIPMSILTPYLRKGFLSYKKALCESPSALSFNVEIKYPTFDEDSFVKSSDVYQNMYAYVQGIVDISLQHCGAREIVFSSFSPEICILTRVMQTCFPVFFLVAETKDDGGYFLNDGRTASAQRALDFCCKVGLCGLVLEASWLHFNPEIIHEMAEKGKQLWTYGKGNNAASWVMQQYDLGVHRVITDLTGQLIGEIRAVGFLTF